MRPDPVVVGPPSLDGTPGVFERDEPVQVQALVSEGPARALNVAVLHGLSRLNVAVLHLPGVRPGIKDPTGELASVVGDYDLGKTSLGPELLEDLNHPYGRRSRQALASSGFVHFRWASGLDRCGRLMLFQEIMQSFTDVHIKGRWWDAKTGRWSDPETASPRGLRGQPLRWDRTRRDLVHRVERPLAGRQEHTGGYEDLVGVAVVRPLVPCWADALDVLRCDREAADRSCQEPSSRYRLLWPAPACTPDGSRGPGPKHSGHASPK